MRKTGLASLLAKFFAKAQTLWQWGLSGVRVVASYTCTEPCWYAGEYQTCLVNARNSSHYVVLVQCVLLPTLA